MTMSSVVRRARAAPEGVVEVATSITGKALRSGGGKSDEIGPKKIREASEADNNELNPIFTNDTRWHSA
jgi:hypothetical protein